MIGPFYESDGATELDRGYRGGRNGGHDSYLDLIAREPLLSPGDQVDLVRKVLDARRARKKLAGGQAGHSAQPNLRAVIREGTVAQERLIMTNTRLVIKVARRYENRGIPLSDLVHEGVIGLIRGIGRFDPDRGIRLSTYATWWIRQGIARAVDNHGRTVRLPVHLTTQISRLAKSYAQLGQILGRDPTLAEQAHALEIPIDKVRELLEHARSELSLEEPLDGTDDWSLGDRLPDLTAPLPEEVAALRLTRAEISRALDNLPAREALVLRQRFGFDGSNPMTLNQIGKRMGITRERVRQVQERAMLRLKDESPGLRELFESLF
jgi:RNA polymerase sigma factor (sigma-70 family)